MRQQDQRLAIRELIKAFSALDGPKKKQKSVTTELLCDMLELTKEMGEFHQHSADLIVGAYFFAMRACEYAKTKTPGQTETLSLGNITFRDKRRRILSHDDPLLEEKAAYVTICFVNQKNGLKMDRRTQARSNHDELCPVRSWARVCKRVRRTTGHCDDNTLVCKIGIKGKGNVFATDESTLNLLRLTCRTYGRTPGQTETLALGNITFRDKRRRILSHDDPLLEEKAAYVTICFVNQKNGLKMDRRTQARSNHDELCPVRLWSRVCKRVRRTTGHCDDNTLVCKIGVKGKGNVFATDESTLKLLRLTCRTYGSDGLYGIEPHELGTKSVRSGGAMALFMMGYSPEKIMILGRWGSTAFLDYIRPQTLEWTNMMSSDMARVPKMMDLNKSHLKRSKTNEEKQWSTFEFLPGFFRTRH